MSLCIIPARGGSKRIPRKNIRDFCGQPMIAWSIDAALKSGVFDQVIVTTDDAEIADVARSAGAEVPFKRPSDLSDDFTTTQPVIAHAIQAMGCTATSDLPVCCLYATAPFVRPTDLSGALAQFANSEAKALVMAITSFAFPIQRALRRDVDGQLSMVQSEYLSTRSQDLEDFWHDAGQFYITSSNRWCNDELLLNGPSYGIELPRQRVQDIDTEEDWQMAELLFRAQTLDH
ncbi:pseudaminic acid cytidylyltransferase [Actibacterium sp. 188UL27-1]|nr:pseudaminic acid cytidylyltransferase [Actibacterium sp. 188UL27-1]